MALGMHTSDRVAAISESLIRLSRPMLMSLIDPYRSSRLSLGIHHHLIFPIDTVAVRPATIRTIRRGVEAQAGAKQIKLTDIGGHPAPFHFGLWGCCWTKPSASQRRALVMALLNFSSKAENALLGKMRL